MNNKKSNVSYDDSTAICGELNFAAAEAYKMLRTNVQYGFSSSSGCKIVGITSSERNEGKSTIAINLAYMLSCDKQRVLLLEGDMRLPSIAKKLGIESTPGLSDYLTGRIHDNEGFKRTDKAPALSIICAGVIPPNPSELLGSASMEKFLEVLKEHFDFIIMDLPPVNIVSDPLSVAKFLDGFIVLVRSEFTSRQGVKDVVKKLQIVNAKILGFVINSDSGADGKYGKYSKYGKYGRYGRYGRYGSYGSYGKYGYGSYDQSTKDYADSYENAAKKRAAKAAPPKTDGSKPSGT